MALENNVNNISNIFSPGSYDTLGVNVVWDQGRNISPKIAYDKFGIIWHYYEIINKK